MYEIIYAGWDVEKMVHENFPSLKIGDASDSIHHDRFFVEGEADVEAFYLFAANNNFLDVCFGFGLLCVMPDRWPEWGDRVVKALKESVNDRVRSRAIALENFHKRYMEKSLCSLCGGKGYLKMRWDVKGVFHNTPCPKGCKPTEQRLS